MKEFNFNLLTATTEHYAHAVEFLRGAITNFEQLENFSVDGDIYILELNGNVVLVSNEESDLYAYAHSHDYSEDRYSAYVFIMANYELDEFCEELNIFHPYSAEVSRVEMHNTTGEIWVEYQDKNGNRVEEIRELEELHEDLGSCQDAEFYAVLRDYVEINRDASEKDLYIKVLEAYTKKQCLTYIQRKIKEDAHQMFGNYFYYYYDVDKDNDVILMSIRMYSQNMKYAYKIFSKSGADLTPHFAKLLGEKMSKNGEIYGSGFGTCRRFLLHYLIKNKLGWDLDVRGVTTKNSSRILQPLNYQTFKHIGPA